LQHKNFITQVPVLQVFPNVTLLFTSYIVSDRDRSPGGNGYAYDKRQGRTRTLMTVMRTGSYPKNYWKGFAALLLAYTLLQLVYYVPTKSLSEVVGKTTFSPLWLLLVMVYVAGAWILSRTGVGWLNVLWHLVHISLISFVLLVLAYGRLIGPVPYGIAAAVRPILEFLISPVLYLAVGLLYRAIR
jgi:hypothetical protein